LQNDFSHTSIVTNFPKVRANLHATLTGMKASKAKTVDAFIAEAAPEARPLLENIRQVVKAAVPDAEETMGYGKPYYKYHGWMTGVTLYTKHLGIEIWDGLTDQDRQALEALGYKTGSKNFQIQYNQAVPTEILMQLVKAQAKRNEQKSQPQPS
jgi:uncharacterized protein YdhG (YjbR/CyaY superfamily)